MIEKLTPEQEAQIQVYKQRGREIGNRTGSLNRKEAEESIRAFYREHLKIPEPRHGVIFCRSPLAAIEILKQRFKVSPKDAENSLYYANFDIGMLLGRCKFFYEVCPVPGVKEASQYLVRLGETCAILFVFDEVCVATDFPSVIRTDERGRSHCIDKPAIEYATDEETGITMKCYAWHGIKVDAELVERPETLTLKRIDRESNVELRRVMLEVYGFERYLLAGNAKLLDKSEWGELYQKDMPNDEPLTMVIVTNSTAEPDGTFKRYSLSVHPELRPRIGKNPDKTPIYGEPQKMTALNAIASTYGMTGAEYAEMEAET